MFPNYCFKKRADEFGYEVLYMPKNNYAPSPNQTSRPLNPTQVRSRSRTQQCPKMCYEDLITLQALREQNEQNGLKPPTASPVRNVEFRLPQMDKQPQFPLRQNGGALSQEREMYRKQQQQQQLQQQEPESSSPSDMPSNNADTVRDLQDSCADFFNIIYENVLEAVNGAVELTVDKHFQDILGKLNQLTTEMTAQASMLKQINTDLISKINELNETNLNQFKFIAQMLIDSQTIHYRAMNQQRLQAQQTNIDEDLQKRSVSSERKQRTSGGCNRCQRSSVNPATQQQQQQLQQQQQQPQDPKQRTQHQLCQQQDSNLSAYRQSTCKNCNFPKLFPKPERAILRRNTKSISTASMPNLHQASFSSSTSNKVKFPRYPRSPTPSDWTPFGTRRLVNPATPTTSSNLKRCRCHCHSPGTSQNINYLLSNNSTLGRKLRAMSKTLPSIEDVRART